MAHVRYNFFAWINLNIFIFQEKPSPLKLNQTPKEENMIALHWTGLHAASPQ